MKIPVLDHGYVEFIEAWGHGKKDKYQEPDTKGNMLACDFEAGIIEAARQSTQGSFRGWEGKPCNCHCSAFQAKAPGNWTHAVDCPYEPGDEKLLSTLFNHQWNQSTPFEAAGMTIEVQAPIMVFREWHRHRTQSYNEASARYKALPDLYWHISLDELFNRAVAAKESTNKQEGSETTRSVDRRELADWLAADQQLSSVLETHYQRGLRIGVPKEIARKKMPMDHYSRMRSTANLRNWLAFLTLRLDPKAQWEIRQFAEAVEQLISQYFPRTHKLFVDREQAAG